MDLSHLVGASFALTLIVGIAALALLVYALVDLFRQPMDTPIRLLWVLVILFFPFIGSLIYLIAGRSTRGTAV